MLDPHGLSVGDAVPGFERQGNVHNWNRFAAVNYEFHAHHWDDAVGQQEGFSGAFAMAPLLHSYLHTMLRDWMGGAGRIVRVDIRLRSPLTQGRVLTAGGKITAIRREAGEVLADLEMWETDDQGTQIASATATVAFPG
jgi:hypothetical protein